MLPASIAQRIAAFIALLALLGFIIIHAYAMIAAWKGTALPKIFVSGSSLSIVANALTGLVSGVVAAGLGIRTQTTQGTPPASRFRGVARVIGLDAKTDEPLDQTRVRLATAYVLAYVMVAVCAIVAWIVTSPNVAELTVTLAQVALGTFVAVVAAYLANS